MTIACALAGATIRYTTSGADPTPSDPAIASGSTVAVDQSLTLKAAAWKSGWNPSTVSSATYTMVVATPTLNPAPGSFVGALPVTVSTTTPGATLNYRLDGGEPTTSDPVVASGSSVTIGQSATLKVIGSRAGWSPSATAVGSYTISLGTAATPVLSPPPGTFTSAQTVTITTSTSGAVIRYTTDGTEPGFQSPVYSGAISVGRTTILKARTFAADMTGSASAGGLYVVDLGTVDPPRFTPGPGRYPTKQTVTVTSGTSGAVIHYRTDGLDPDESDPVVASGATVVVDKNLRLMARAFKAGVPKSPVTSGEYGITGAVAIGASATFALKGDGTLLSWGRNEFFVLGDPTVGNFAVRSTPGPVANLTDVVAIAAGGSHALALKRDGTLWAWGRNYVGELGDGTTTDRASPVQVLNLTNVVAIAAGTDHSVAVKGDGTVWIWGTAETSYGTTPVQVSGLTGVTSVAGGSYKFTLAVKTDGMPSGSLWSWGNNQTGQLGDGTVTARTTPVSVAQGVVSAAAGNFHAYALRSDGTALAWGLNNVGQLGDGTTNNQYRPAPIPSLSGVTSLAAGGHYGLATLSDATVWSWGYNGYGQLGDRTFSDRSTPGPATLVSVVSVAAWGAANHSAAVPGDGTLWTWGKNDYGTLGDGTTTHNVTPKPVPNLTLVAAGLLSVDTDGDGLSNWDEVALGTDGRKADTNGDGILDGAAVKAGISATNTDMDGDTVSNLNEVSRGSDPFRVDTDGDSVNDATDAFPLDPTRWQAPPPNPNDTTPPGIQLLEPTNATLISSVPPQ